jgi:hypothetical protein
MMGCSGRIKTGFTRPPHPVSNGQIRTFNAGTVVLAGRSIDSPKLMRRSSMFQSLPQSVQNVVDRGLTDHPRSNEITTFPGSIHAVQIPKSAHA